MNNETKFSDRAHEVEAFCAQVREEAKKTSEGAWEKLMRETNEYRARVGIPPLKF